ncbi:MAG: NUDIX domain-containing protein [bacterium]|nr:NUDIX domain-containing protein [bacterium]
MVDPDSAFGDDWQPGPDGMLFRNGARVLLFNEHGHLLLIRGHDWGKEDRSWWFTVGGGLEHREDPRAGAVRETREETGIELQPEELEGPVADRSAIFDFALRTVRQDELFFVAHVHARELDTSGQTAAEAHLLDEYRWWNLDDLQAAQRAGATIYPGELVGLARSVVGGWDGTLTHLGD